MSCPLLYLMFNMFECILQEPEDSKKPAHAPLIPAKEPEELKKGT